MVQATEAFLCIEIGSPSSRLLHRKMDYMNLGVRSRKTGLNVKENIKKDEYSMENIDDFFDDDETSVVSARGQSRRSSLLSVTSGNKLLYTPPIQTRRPLIQQNKGFKVPSSIAGLSRRSTQHSQQYEGQLQSVPLDNVGLDSLSEVDLPFGSQDAEHKTPSPLPQPSYTEDYNADALHESPSIRLTPQHTANVSYKSIPDLVEDDEDTRDFTSLNTSENALLEDELDDDYRVESEEDGDYIEGESSLENAESSEDAKESDSSDNGDSSDSGDLSDSGHSVIRLPDRFKRVDSHHQTGYRLGRDSPTEVYDSDEEYIQSQAAELIGNGPSRGPDGVRRSTRVKIAPLEYWRNEKIVYKKKSDKPVLEIDRIITYDHDDDDEEEELLGRRKKKQKKSTARTRPYNYIPTGRPRGRPRKAKKPLENDTNPNADLIHEMKSGNVPTAEWLQFGILEAKVNVSKDRTSDEIIAFAPNLAQSEQVRDTEDESFSLEIMFDKHKDHFASGMLKLPIRGSKKLGDSYNAFMTFYLVQGIVEVTLAGKTFMITEGSTFQIPAFNEYAFENKGMNDVRMFFVQVTVTEGNLGNERVDNTEDLMADLSNTRRDSDAVKSDDNHAPLDDSSLSNMSISEI